MVSLFGIEAPYIYDCIEHTSSLDLSNCMDDLTHSDRVASELWDLEMMVQKIKLSMAQEWVKLLVQLGIKLFHLAFRVIDYSMEQPIPMALTVYLTILTSMVNSYQLV